MSMSMRTGTWLERWECSVIRAEERSCGIFFSVGFSVFTDGVVSWADFLRGV